MTALYFLLPIALVLGGAFVALFVWAVGQGQFDDLDDAPQRMLRDEE
jgi:cbb3-type cytochrome oxidase maturation protein